jgi:hypothetical protein
MKIESNFVHSKPEMIRNMADFILNRDAAYVRLMNGSSRETALLRKCIESDQSVTVENTSDFRYYAQCGYCYLSKESKLLVPDEVAVLFRETVTDEFERKQRRYWLLRNYISAAVNLYVFISPEDLLCLFNSQNNEATSEKEILETHYRMRFRDPAARIYDGKLTDKRLVENEDAEAIYEALRHRQEGKPFYLPPKKIFIQYADEGFFEKGAETEAVRFYLRQQYGLKDGDAAELLADIRYCIYAGGDIREVFGILREEGIIPTKQEQVVIERLLVDLCNHTRLPENRGFTPMEIFGYERKRHVAGGKVIPFKRH